MNYIYYDFEFSSFPIIWWQTCIGKSICDDRHRREKFVRSDVARSPQIILAGFMTMQYNLLTGTYPDRSCSDNFLTNKWTMEDSGRPTVRYSVMVEHPPSKKDNLFEVTSSYTRVVWKIMRLSP